MGGTKRGSSTERSSRDNWPSTLMTGWKALTAGGQSQLQSPVLSNPVVRPMQCVEIRQQPAHKVLEPEMSLWWESLHTHTQFLV